MSENKYIGELVITRNSVTGDIRRRVLLVDESEEADQSEISTESQLDLQYQFPRNDDYGKVVESDIEVLDLSNSRYMMHFDVFLSNVGASQSKVSIQALYERVWHYNWHFNYTINGDSATRVNVEDYYLWKFNGESADSKIISCDMD